MVGGWLTHVTALPRIFAHWRTRTSRSRAARLCRMRALLNNVTTDAPRPTRAAGVNMKAVVIIPTPAR